MTLMRAVRLAEISAGLVVVSREFARQDKSSGDVDEFQVMLLAVTAKEFEGAVSIEPEPLHQDPLSLADLLSSIDPLRDGMLLPRGRQSHRSVSSQNVGNAMSSLSNASGSLL